MTNDSSPLLTSEAINFQQAISSGGVEAISKTSIYIVMAILSCLSIVGTAGNALVLYVFAKKRDRLTSTLFILSLAFVDFITCLFVIPYTIYMEYVNFHVKYDVSCKVYQFLITSNIPFSALIMVAIAIDRYFCICHPFLHAINMFRAKVIVMVLALVATALGVIVAMMYGVYKNMPYPVSGTTAHFNHSNLSSVHTSNYSSSLSGVMMPDSTYTVDEAREMVFPLNSSINLANDQPIHVIVVYTGNCDSNTFILSDKFQWYYQRFYSGLFLICLISVIILYVLIYKSVFTRRTRRQKQNSRMIPLLVASRAPSDNNGNGNVEETIVTTVNGETPTMAIAEGKEIETVMVNDNTLAPPNMVRKPTKNCLRQNDKAQKKSTKKDKNRVANLKTAAMLFVVTVVFIITFLPSFLMALNFITYNVIVFYLYFANNVANPVIYSFMNKNFRDDLRKLFCGRY